MAVTKLSPVANNVPIADPKTGNVTPYFQRMLQTWLKEKAAAETAAITLGNLGGDPGFDRLIRWNTTTNLFEFITFSQALDMVGSPAQGDILYRNGTIWTRLPAGTSGQFLKTLGPGANPLWAAAGGSTAVPSLSSTGYATWLNQGTATAADTIYGVNIGGPAEGSLHRLRGRYKAVPSTPYRIKAEFKWGIAGGTAAGIIFGWRDSATGKLHCILVQWSAGTFRSDWSDASTGAAFTSIGSSPQGRFCLQLRDDGTNVHMELSYNMSEFNTLYSIAKSAGYLGATGYNQLILGVDNFNGAGSYILSDYAETA